MDLSNSNQEVNNSNDVIGRQDAIDAFNEYEDTDLIKAKYVRQMLAELPSAQPDVPDTNVGDMISRQAAIDFIAAGHFCNPNEPRWSDNEVVNFLKSRPSAQPEIIRCKDCKWSDISAMGHLAVCNHSRGLINASPHSYCNFAERRTDG